MVDLRIDKSFALKGRVKLGILFDVYNLFNANTELNIRSTTGRLAISRSATIPTFNTPLTILPPRIARISARLDWWAQIASGPPASLELAGRYLPISASISLAESPASARTSRVCSPSRGASRLTSAGVAEKRVAGLGRRSRPSVGWSAMPQNPGGLQVLVLQQVLEATQRTAGTPAGSSAAIHSAVLRVAITPARAR